MRHYRLTTYEAKDGHRWRLVAPNGRIMADGGEAYTRAASALRAAWRLLDLMQQGRVQITQER